MDHQPLIDISEPERIAALTRAPGTVSFRADAAENLDGLVPDVGLTGKYPYRSVYRPRSFARAGLPATLTHRFWDTVDHTGRRWIGVVMYDEHGYDCRLEITLGADPIGGMVPFRHDNRRHLYVLDRSVHFMGEMEVLRITGSGDAGYRLERVLLLKERPAPTSYQPRLERLAARLRRRSDGSYAVAVDGISWPATRCEVTLVRSDTGATVATAPPADYRSLHAITVVPVPAPPAAGYRTRIRATEMSGRHCDAEVAVADGSAATGAGAGTAAGAGAATGAVAATDTAAAVKPGDPVTVPMEVTNLAATGLSGLPVTFALPVPRGCLFGPTTGRWEMAGATTPVQCRPHAFWPDGSASWVLLDGPLQQPVEPSAKRFGTVSLDPASPASPPPDGLRWEATEDGVSVAGDSLRVQVGACG